MFDRPPEGATFRPFEIPPSFYMYSSRRAQGDVLAGAALFRSVSFIALSDCTYNSP